MHETSNNPKQNQLPVSIKEDAIIDALKKSGYPLQGIVSSLLKNEFNVTEEWGYIDRDTNQHRSLDVFCYKTYPDLEVKVKDIRPSQLSFYQVSPNVALLIECKRSEQPFIFFKNLTQNKIPHFPLITGVREGYIPISRKDDGSKFKECSIQEILGLDEHRFISDAPYLCSTFCKIKPKGKDFVELSGEEIYSGIVLPLVKAQEHTNESFRVKRGNIDQYLYPVLIFSIVVIDSPILIVENPVTPIPILTPWIRLVRQESGFKDGKKGPIKYYGIDVVHSDFLRKYINDHFLPFAQDFATRVNKLASVIVNGARVDDIDNFTWESLIQ